ncbi:hypothetical protein HDV57DRAFT_200880 [Trichoderma longibrachiatum]|uniref:Uncharacterized protein n=1 Tax=Trichoderma longibrachiatum ATCC 18648 TaxID=983965 RepID=A0A2T4C893_TRILO|nr:hypothetical protein M440DRAFT_292171 [Trichoderma longibrachiatum ATCC 18648]
MHFAGPAVMLQVLSNCACSHVKVTIDSHICFFALSCVYVLTQSSIDGYLKNSLHRLSASRIKPSYGSRKPAALLKVRGAQKHTLTA